MLENQWKILLIKMTVKIVTFSDYLVVRKSIQLKHEKTEPNVKNVSYGEETRQKLLLQVWFAELYISLIEGLAIKYICMKWALSLQTEEFGIHNASNFICVIVAIIYWINIECNSIMWDGKAVTFLCFLMLKGICFNATISPYTSCFSFIAQSKIFATIFGYSPLTSNGWIDFRF